MLVSSIGYFNNPNRAFREYSVNSRITKADKSAGFGQVQSDNMQNENNFVSRLLNNIKALFTSQKPEKSDNKVSVVV